MKRDIEKIRNIMIYLENELEPKMFMSSSELPFYNEEDTKDYKNLLEHITLLVEDEMLEIIGTPCMTTGNIDIRRITSKGHDFLDTLRSDNIWENTSKKAKTVGVSSISFLMDIGKEYIKQEILKI